jgi:hypothetical protein
VRGLTPPRFRWAASLPRERGGWLRPLALRAVPLHPVEGDESPPHWVGRVWEGTPKASPAPEGEGRGIAHPEPEHYDRHALSRRVQRRRGRPVRGLIPRGLVAPGSAPSRCARSPSTQWRGTRALPTGWGGFGRGRPRPAPLPREKGVVSRIPSRNTMTATSHIDVFNGDADGLCALQQLRLAEPGSAPSRCARSPSTQWRGTRALPTGWGGLGGDAQGRCRASPVGEACPERSRRRGRGNEVSTPPLLACVLI